MALPYAKARADAQPEMQYSFPYVSWKHGQQAYESLGGIAHTGGLMLGSDSYNQDTKIPGWTEQTVPTKKGNIKAMCANPVYITILRWREKWEENENGKVRSNLHAIGLIRGFDELVCFQASGYTTRNINAFLREHQKVAAAANKNRPQGTPPLPPYLFWIKIEAGKREEVGDRNGSSWVTQPQAVLPLPVTMEYAEKAFVGEALMDYLQEQYVVLEPWQSQWPASKRDQDEGQGGRNHEEGDAYTVPEYAGRPKDEFDGALQHEKRRAAVAGNGGGYRGEPEPMEPEDCPF